MTQEVEAPMQSKRYQDQMETDCWIVQQVVEAKPGIRSKQAIAEACGLRPHRVATVLKQLGKLVGTTWEEGDVWVRYGKLEGRTGWWLATTENFHELRLQRVTHAQRVQRGIRKSIENGLLYMAMTIDPQANSNDLREEMFGDCFTREQFYVRVDVLNAKMIDSGDFSRAWAAQQQERTQEQKDRAVAELLEQDNAEVVDDMAAHFADLEGRVD